MRHLFITCFVHFSQICQDNPTTMGTSCLLSQVGVRKNFLHSYFLCILFTIYFFRSTKHVVSHLSSLFLPTAPQAMERKKWMLDNFLSATRGKKGLMFLLSWKMTIFPIFLCLLCVGEWWPTHRELPESLCLSAFILFICENKKIDSNEIILGSHIRKSSLGYILKSLHFMRKLWPIANNIVGNSISLKQFIFKV